LNEETDSRKAIAIIIMEHQIHMLTHHYLGQSLGGRMTHAAAATSNDIKML
jgi:hypothetical protein